MTFEELLPGLRDIQPPAAPGWWMIAPAYLLAFTLVIVVVAALWWVVRYRRRNRPAILAELNLQRIRSAYQGGEDTRLLALDLSKWLKQVAMMAFPARQLQGLCGQPWLEFLDQCLQSNHFSDGEGRVFGAAIYSEYLPGDGSRLIALCEQWLCAVKPRLLKHGKA